MSQIHGFVGRRDFLRQIGAVGFGVAVARSLWPLEAAEAATLGASVKERSDQGQSTNHRPTPDTALDWLLQGNQRFQQHRPQYPHQSSARLQEVAQAQQPFATILSCADSRVPAEILFDRGIGDLFDIRVAGNIVTPEVLGSLEYAAVMLTCPLIMVLGHERCGAVTAAVQGEPLPGEMGTFVKAITPAITEIPNLGDLVEQAVIANIGYQMKQVLQRSPLIAKRVQAEQIKIIGGRYDLDTGKVTLVV
jgi:carbonic anhydrase